MALELLPVLAGLWLSTASGNEPHVLRLAVAPAETLAVTTAGTGEPVIMVPGLLGSAYTFRHVRKALATAGYRVLIIEPLGTGASSRPEQADYSLTAQSHRIEAALDSLGIRSPVLLCHSVGASICLRLAARRPDLAAGLVSINGGAAESAGTPGLRFALKFSPLLKLFGAEGYIRGKIRDGLVDSSYDASWVTAEVVREYTAAFDGDLGGALDALERMVEAEEPDSLRPQLVRIDGPVHLLVGTGADDPVPADEIAILRAGLAAFRLDSVPETGLYIQEERPAAVVEAVIALARAEATVSRQACCTIGARLWKIQRESHLIRSLLARPPGAGAAEGPPTRDSLPDPVQRLSIPPGTRMPERGRHSVPGTASRRGPGEKATTRGARGSPSNGCASDSALAVPHGRGRSSH